MKIRIIVFFLSLSNLLLAQVKPVKDVRKPIGNDCSSAIPINITTSNYYGPTVAPSGFGKKQEIRKSSAKLFDEEHNTAWYMLNISRDGELAFEIIPKDTSNDYDFALFKYKDSTSCESIKKNTIKPVRTNLSNLVLSKKGITGLRGSQKDTLIGKGPGNAFSKSIFVKKGEHYLLILDNVTPEGDGHTIFFNFVKDVEIKGKVLGADSIPIVADITLSDNKGNVVEETQSNASGEYTIKTTIHENQNYSLTYEGEGTFVQTNTINTKDLKGKSVFPDIRTVLPKLKKGEKYKLGNINFEGDRATLLPESYPSVEALGKLMRKNKKMVIVIQGHVNGVGFNTKSEELFEQKLSEDRANAVYDMMIKKGIDKERMTTEGFAGKKMIYPNPKTEYEAMANRRVEIKVVSIE